MNASRFFERRQYPQAHRLYEPFNDIMVMVTAMQLAMASHLRVELPDEPAARLNTTQCDFAIAMPLGGAFTNAMRGLKSEIIEIARMAPATPENRVDGPIAAETTGLSQVIWHLIAATYLKYFEPYCEWLDDNLGQACDWPPTLNFCRVVRNSIAHGEIHIRNPSAAPVRWRGLEYGPAQNGQAILGHGLSVGDLVQLMIESSDELDSVGAPNL